MTGVTVEREGAGLLMADLEQTLRALIEEGVQRALRKELRLAIEELRSAAPTAKEFLSVQEAAELVDVSQTTVREWMAAGLRHYQKGRVVRLRRSELLAFLSVKSPQAEAEVDVEQHAVAILAKARGG
jgi:excisionase family DNA binding protein